MRRLLPKRLARAAGRGKDTASQAFLLKESTVSRHSNEIEASSQLKHVRYEIRGKLARRAHELERQGYEIVQLNIGNPGLFGLRTPETMRLAMIENSCDDAERAVRERMFRGAATDFRQVYVVSELTRQLDRATDSLVHSGLLVRDYVLSVSPGG